MDRWRALRWLRRAPAWDTPELRSQVAGGLLLAALLWMSFIFYPSLRSEIAFKIIRVLFLGATGVLALLSLRRGRSYVAKAAFGAMLLGHLALALLSQLAVRDPDGWTYFWLGTSNRPDGFLYQVIIAIFAWALFGTLTSRTRARVFARDVVIVLCVVFALQSIIVLMQRFGEFWVVKTLWVFAYFPIAGGTIGNSGMVAGLILPGIPILLALIHVTRGRRRVVAALVPLLLYGLALSATSNKSSVFVAVALALGFIAFSRTWRVGIAGALVVAALVGGSPLLPNRTDTRQDLGNVGAIEGRLIIWHTAFDAIRHIPQEPLLGWGSDAFRVAQARGVVSPRDLIPFHIRRNPSWKKSDRVDHFKIVHKPGQPLRSAAIVYYVDQGGPKLVAYAFPLIVDRAHDYFLDRTLSYGALDALIWLLLFGVPIVIGVRSRDWMFRGVALAILCVLVYYLAWFPVPETEAFHVALIVLGWYFVALHWHARGGSGSEPAPPRDGGAV